MRIVHIHKRLLALRSSFIPIYLSHHNRDEMNCSVPLYNIKAKALENKSTLYAIEWKTMMNVMELSIKFMPWASLTCDVVPQGGVVRGCLYEHHKVSRLVRLHEVGTGRRSNNGTSVRRGGHWGCPEQHPGRGGSLGTPVVPNFDLCSENSTVSYGNSQNLMPYRI